MRFVPVLVIAFTVGVAAQPPGQGGRQGRGGDDMSPAEIQRIFDGYMVVQVQDALGLSEQQFAQVVPRLKALQDARRRHQLERGRLLIELQRLTRPAGDRRPDDAAIRERIDKLQENETRFSDELRRAYAALDEVLDVRQQGRFRVLEEQIERKKLELLLRARQNPNRMTPRRQPPGR